MVLEPHQQFFCSISGCSGPRAWRGGGIFDPCLGKGVPPRVRNPDPVEDKNTLKRYPCVGQRNTKKLELPVRSILSMRACYNTNKWKNNLN